MNNKTLFIKHSTIKRNVALDFPINIFTSFASFPLLPRSLSCAFHFSPLHPTLDFTSSIFVSGELYHFIAIIFIILWSINFYMKAQRDVKWWDWVKFDLQNSSWKLKLKAFKVLNLLNLFYKSQNENLIPQTALPGTSCEPQSTFNAFLNIFFFRGWTKLFNYSRWGSVAVVPLDTSRDLCVFIHRSLQRRWWETFLKFLINFSSFKD